MSRWYEIATRPRISSLHLIRLTELILLIALAIILADLVAALITVPGDAEVSDTGNPAANYINRQEAGEVSDVHPSVALKALFGRTSGPGDDRGLIAEPVRETRLNLILKGIIADSTTEDKLALIASGGEEDVIYRKGDDIAGAEIVFIDSRRVILRRNGVNESLSLKTEELKEQPAGPGESGGSRGLNGGDSRIVSRKTVDQHLNSLPQVLKQAKTAPYIKNGQQAGFKVVELDGSSVFSDLGLKQDDVIRAVNGISIRNNREALQAYQDLRAATAFQIDILRDGREVTLNYSIQ